jgi:hypothetical protein
MIQEYNTYTIGSHFVCALEYGDYSGLTDEEENELENFIASLPRGYHVWQWGDSEEFSRCEVSDTMGQCINAVLFVDSI